MAKQPKRIIIFDPLKMFQSAETYWRAGVALKNEALRTHDDELTWAAAACQAFALELYLKCLFVLDYVKAPPRDLHNLYKLFNALTADTRAAIEARMDTAQAQQFINDAQRASGSIKPPPKYTIALALERSRNAFSVLRYIYEYGDLPHDGSWIAGPVVEAAARVIADRNPTWKNSRPVTIPAEHLAPRSLLPTSRSR